MENTLGGLFNGAPEVTVDITKHSYAEAVAEAERAGYRQVHPLENEHGPFTILFEKV